MVDRNLMPIGKFSSCCRLSIKALRYYDEHGLLTPAYVDPATGYRYYARTQARDAVAIAMLRTLGLPVPQIRAVLDEEGDARRELLTRHRDQVRRDLERTRNTLLAVERIVETGRLFPYDIAVRIEPEHTVARSSCTTCADQMVKDSGELMNTLIAELEAAGRSYEDPVMCINEEPDDEDQIVVYACIGVHPPYSDLDSVEIAQIPGGPVASLIHRGAYEALGISYHALSAWAQERGHAQRAPVREIYLNNPADVPTSELETEVLLPIAV